MLLTGKKKQSRLLGSRKAYRIEARRHEQGTAGSSHELQLAVVDAVEWAAERWASRHLVEANASDPRPVHAARLVAALVYLDARFSLLDLTFVTDVIERVTRSAADGGSLDAKAAAALLTVEVRAFSR